MAWTAFNIYLEHSDRDPVIETLRGVLADPGVRADRTGILHLPPPLVVAPAHQGWVAITCGRGWFKSLVEPARRLSEVHDTKAASCELMGNCLQLRYSEHTRGEQQRLLETPEVVWGDSWTFEEPMPQYDDAEQLAFRGLRGFGVPAEVAAVGLEPLGADADEMITVGEARRVTSGEEPEEPDRPDDEPLPERFDLKIHPIGGHDAPIVAADASTDFGLQVFETRYVEGRPADAAIDRLIELEERWLERLKRHQRGDKVSLTMTYCSSAFQAELDAMLRARGRHTLPSARRPGAPWWQLWRYFGRRR